MARQAAVPTREYDEGTFSGLGSFWILNYKLDNSPFRLRRVDPSSGRVLAETTIRGTGSMGQALRNWVVAAEGSVWVEAGDKLIRLDPNTLRETVRLTMPPLRAAVIEHGVLWAIDSGDGGLWRVDLDTNTATQVLKTCCFAQTIAVDGHYVWFTHNTQAEVARQDLVRVDEAPPYRALSTHIQTGDVAASKHSVWYLGTTGTHNADASLLVHLNPEKLTHEDVTHVEVTTAPYINASVEVINGVAWIADDSRTLTRVTPISP